MSGGGNVGAAAAGAAAAVTACSTSRPIGLDPIAAFDVGDAVEDDASGDSLVVAAAAAADADARAGGDSMPAISALGRA